jgi:hypothetical protein
MKPIKVVQPPVPFKLADYRTKIPKASDVSLMISEEALVHVDGKVRAIYKKADFDLTTIRHACNALKFEMYLRTSGLQTYTLNINASPRNGLRSNKCQFTKFHRTQPSNHNVFLINAKKIAGSYRKYFRKAYANQIKQSYIGQGRVNEIYRIKGTPFTSGVINKDTALGYHRDLANTKDGISCMLILKKGIAGGELILPELNIGFSCQDGYMLLFDGQKYLHGVTPILDSKTLKGYRYTIVYYNNKGMSLCLPPVEEEEQYKLLLEKQTYRRYKRNLDNER